MIWFGWVLWHINHCWILNDKSSLYIYIIYIHDLVCNWYKNTPFLLMSKNLSIPLFKNGLLFHCLIFSFLTSNLLSFSFNTIIYTYKNTHTYTHIHVHTHTKTLTPTHTYPCTYTYKNTHTYTHIHPWKCTYILIHTQPYICTYKYTHIYTYISM